jgi:hypothetical protein
LSSGVEVDLSGGSETIPGASIELSIDPHPSDAKHVQLALLVKWPMIRMSISNLKLPPEAKAQLKGRELLEVNVTPKPPKSYLEEVERYLNKFVIPFLKAAAR